MGIAKLPVISKKVWHHQLPHSFRTAHPSIYQFFHPVITAKLLFNSREPSISIQSWKLLF